GSPPVYPIGPPLRDTDNDGIPDAWELAFDAINTLDQLGADGDFDGDGLLDPDE
ncbi:MAG: hypothetical protein GWO24_07920, partial [Akkermansiaceae bacterium]|nr:hypothetical protein [Akkermansiaceae bacterium]